MLKKIAMAALLSAAFLNTSFAAEKKSAAAKPAADKPVADTAPTKTIPILIVSQEVLERRDGFDFFSTGGMTIHELTRAVRKAAKDAKVSELVIKFEDPEWGMGAEEEFEEALRDYRASGKPLHTYYDQADIMTYAASSYASDVVITPVGELDLHGAGLSLYFFHDLMDKLGAHMQVVNTGIYKDAFEPFTNQEMSAGTREQMTVLLNDWFDEFTRIVAKNRSLSEADARKMLTDGPYTSAAAVKAHAVDRAMYLDDLLDEIEDKAGAPVNFDWDYSEKGKKPELIDLMSLLSGAVGGSTKRVPAGDKIAVVYALGDIEDGRASQGNPLSRTDEIASDDFIDLLDDATDSDDVKALVLRVDSPGGSAIASDRIWRHLKRLQEDGIPVVVSMGDMAASGGYYISMGADKIFAQPNTITGSIGVIGGKVVLGDTYKKLGINKQKITIGDNTGLDDEDRDWNPHELEILNAELEYTYKAFSEKAAEGRGMTVDQINKLAGGRVWSGTAAKANGLIDEIGGLKDAIAAARELAKSPNAKIVEYPKELTPMEMIESYLSGGPSITAAAPPQLFANNPLLAAAGLIANPRQLRQLLFVVQQMKDKPAAMVLMPWIVKMD